MPLKSFALCVKFSNVNASEIVAAARKHKVGILHIENYDSRKDLQSIFDEYPLEIPSDAKLYLLLIFPGGETILTDREHIPHNFDKVNQYLLDT